MSAIFGIYTTDNHMVQAESLKRMADELSYRGPDGVHTWQQEAVGLGHCILRTTPKASLEHLPYTDQENELTITADARIDNREELAELLGIKKHFLNLIDDSQLIIAAYRKWGVDCCIKLLGDFSFAIWDGRLKRLFCARDAIGIKPFYYSNTHQSFTFCSDLKPLVTSLPSPPPINEGMVGEHLTFQFSSRRETLFVDVFRLPPAHYLIVEDGRLSIHRYWDLSFPRPLYYKDTNEYAEHFLNLFQQAVSCRMRSHLPVSAELSGGLDSSSIVSIASSFNQVSHKQDLRPFALIFPGLPCDEQGYINSVARRWEVNVNNVPADQFQLPDWQNQVLRSFHFPDMPNLSMCDTLVQQVSASNSRVILSGIGGDEWFTGSITNLIDLIAHHKFSELNKEFRFQGSHRYKTLIKKLAQVLLWPATPAFIKEKMCKKSIRHVLPDWLPDSFITKIDLIDRIAKSDARLHLKSLIDASYYKYILSDDQGFFLETLGRHRAFAGVENRYPFLDRRLIEYAANLPEYQKVYNGKSKHVVRQGLNNLLPDKVRDRSDKAEFSYFFGQAFLQSEFEKNITELRIADNGWIKKNKLLEIYREAQQHFKNNPTKPYNKIWPIWFAFATELWFKTLYNH
jgi:asparagine synthase (glutamine-hydrolysing)